MSDIIKPLKIGTRVVESYVYPHCLPGDLDVGEVVGRTDKPVSSINRRGRYAHYYGLRVQWSDGSRSWVPQCDLVEVDSKNLVVIK